MGVGWGIAVQCVDVPSPRRHWFVPSPIFSPLCAQLISHADSSFRSSCGVHRLHGGSILGRSRQATCFVEVGVSLLWLNAPLAFLGSLGDEVDSRARQKVPSLQELSSTGPLSYLSGCGWAESLPRPRLGHLDLEGEGVIFVVILNVPS